MRSALSVALSEQEWRESFRNRRLVWELTAQHRILVTHPPSGKSASGRTLKQSLEALEAKL